MQAKLYHGTPAVKSGEGRTQLCELVGGWFKRQIQSGEGVLHAREVSSVNSGRILMLFQVVAAEIFYEIYRIW